MTTRTDIASLAVKLAVTAAIVAGIGGLIVLGSDGTPSDSHADIIDLASSGAPSNEKRFLRAMKSVGHDDLHTYEVNGNRVHVSTRRLDASPRRAMRDYQRAFVQRGLNDEAYNELTSHESMARRHTMLTGGIVPTATSPHRVVMQGVLTRGRPQSHGDLVERLNANLADRDDASPMTSLFEGFRWIEIEEMPRSNRSRAVAIWSDDDIDYDAMSPSSMSQDDGVVDPRVPQCADCQRVHQFSDVQHEGAHETYIFTSEQSRRQLRRFYRDRLEEGGWEKSRSTPLFERLKDHVELGRETIDRLRYTRDGRTMHVDIYPIGESRRTIRVRLVDETFTEANRQSTP
jgi:hypothetical protein